MSQLLFFIAGLIVGLGAAYYTGALKGGMDGPKNAGFPEDSPDVRGGWAVADGQSADSPVEVDAAPPAPATAPAPPTPHPGDEADR